MASLTVLKCSHCNFRLEGWSDGHPYLTDLHGKRHYYNHPCEDQMIDCFFNKVFDHRLTPEEKSKFYATHSGCESDFFCTACGAVTRLDEECDPMKCSACNSAGLVAVLNLEGSTCQKCAHGTLHGEVGAIS